MSTKNSITKIAASLLTCAALSSPASADSAADLAAAIAAAIADAIADAAAQAAAGKETSGGKHYAWGDSTFGVSTYGYVDADYSQGIKKMTNSGTLKATLFGQSMEFGGHFNGTQGPTSSLSGGLTLNGITLASKSNVNLTNINFAATIGQKELFKASKQFSIVGIPVIVKADVTASAAIGNEYVVNPVGGIYNYSNWKIERGIYGSLGCAGTITAGPGSDIIGAGIYGSISFGELKVAGVDESKIYNPYQVSPELRIDFDIGTFEAGLKAWLGPFEAKVKVVEISGFKKNLLTIVL